ncbi:MAG: hypothetical protein DRI73_00880, partial [Bacteroidetes bacterium]
MRSVFLKYLILIFLLPAESWLVWGSDIKREIFVYTPLEGLSQSVVTSLAKDKEGFIWIGTEDGLNQFDGIEFKIFRFDPNDSLSLPDNFISVLKTDNAGNLWIGTANGLSFYNRETKVFRNYLLDNPVSGITPMTFIHDILPDRDNKVWVALRDKLLLLDSQTGKTVQVLSKPGLFRNSSFRKTGGHLFKLKDKIWVFSNNKFQKVHSLQSDSLGFRISDFMLPFRPDKLIKLALIDKEGQLWCVSEQTAYQVSLNGSFAFTSYKISSSGKLASEGVKQIFQDDSGKIWLTTEYNMFVNEGSGFVPSSVGRAYFDKVGRMPITAIIEDNSRILWLGSRHGLIKMDMKPGNFKVYGKNGSHPGDIEIKSVTSFFEDKKDQLWVGTLGNGLFMFSPDRKKITSLNSHSKKIKHRICNDQILCLYEDRNEELWIGTRSGIMVYNPLLGSCYKLKDIKGLSLIDKSSVYRLKEDNKGNMLVGTESGLIVFDRNKNEFESIWEWSDELGRLAEGRVYSIYVDKKNRYWIGTQNGLTLINPVKRNHLEINQLTNGSPFSRSVLSVFVDKEKRMWVGTRDGLAYLDTVSMRLELLSSVQDFPKVSIYGITEDSSGNLWASSSAGLIYYSPHDLRYRFYNKFDGLKDNEFTSGAWLQSKTGEVFLGGYDGFSSFVPDSFKINPNKPNVAITDFRYLAPTGWRDVSITEKEIRLKTGRSNSIFIKYSILEFTNPMNNKSEYMLEGYDKEWKKGANPGNVIYSNLKRGTYVFKVRGANSDGIWADEEGMQVIRVTTPFQSTKLAYFLYIVLLAATIIQIIRYWTQNLRKANQVLKEKEIAAMEIARQREELAVKNKNITDSIRYAQKIQEAMLPSAYIFKRLFPESFVIFRPKDFISGDFYWITEKDDKQFVVSADCTGHGVPGALMSMIGFEILDKIINDQKVYEPAEILNILSKGIEATFSRNEDDLSVKDGMDIALCMVDKKKKRLEFAGAFNSLYLIRDNRLTEIKGDRFSIGLTANEFGKPFTNHFLELENEDRIYIFTDGY